MLRSASGSFDAAGITYNCKLSTATTGEGKM